MICRAGFACTALALIAAALGAERLPWNVYTTANGLAGDAVRGLFQDSRGFLWVATNSGLSRFDGQVFRSYDTADGLPSPRVHEIVETSDGSIWAASNEGLSRMPPVRGRDGHPFEVVPLPASAEGVTALLAARRGELYVGLSTGVIRIGVRVDGSLTVEEVALPVGVEPVTTLAEGERGELWVGGATELLRRDSDGSLARWKVDPRGTGLRATQVDRTGRLWILSDAGLLVWVPPANVDGFGAPRRSLVEGARRPSFLGDLPERPGDVVLYDAEHGLPSRFPTAIALGRDSVWVATRHGVVSFASGGMTVIGMAQGLVEPLQYAVLEDDEGTLWLGSDSSGLSRLRRSGFVAFGEPDGLSGDRISQLFEGPARELFVVTWARDLHRFDGRRFEKLTPRFEAAVEPGWGWNQFVLRDSRGRFWFPTAGGLFRFPALERDEELARTRPERRWTTANGLPGDDVFRLFEDRQGRIWVSTIATQPLVRVEGDAIVPVPEIRGLEAGGSPSAFAEDRAGNLWIGFYLGGLARLSDRGWQFFREAPDVPSGFVGDLHLDRNGRLWGATNGGGVVVIDDPTATRPRFRRYTSHDGLTTDSTRCLAEESGGGIFIGHSRGVDRLDPATGFVRAFSSEDGLPNNLVWNCRAATDGTLWFGTLRGLARYLPPRESSRRPPGIWLTEVRVAGQEQAVPERGVERISEIVLGPRQSSLEVSYVGVGLGLGRNLLFQHRVIGATPEWSEPTRARSVQFAALAAGRYRFEVRAVTRDGLSSPGAATLDFTVEPPFWRRSGFVALVAAALALLTILLVRLRTARLLAVERARTRIASDLHDDVGSSVSRIGLLGELARRRVREEPAAAERILAEIGEEATELAEATSDIVWSIDPRRDDLGSLVIRLRRFAADLLEAKEIELEFEAPADAAALALSPEVRRALYLALKESIHNVAKHSSARSAWVRIAVEGGEVVAEVTDDGVGIDPARAAKAAAEGRHGLGGLVTRAAAVGGSARIEAGSAGGTRVVLRFPAGRRQPGGSHRDAISGPGRS